LMGACPRSQRVVFITRRSRLVFIIGRREVHSIIGRVYSVHG
jgi:hypothetical protein